MMPFVLLWCPGAVKSYGYHRVTCFGCLTEAICLWYGVHQVADFLLQESTQRSPLFRNLGSQPYCSCISHIINKENIFEMSLDPYVAEEWWLPW